MKKVLLLLYVLLIAVFAGMSFGGEVFALDTPYVYNSENDVWLLDRDTSEKLFILPATYYAKLDNIEENFYMITYNGVKAKIEKDKVSTIGYHKTPISTIRDIQIAEKYRDFSMISLRTSMSTDTVEQVATNANLLFLGVYDAGGKIWYYVGFENIKGYVNPEFTTIPEISFEKFVPEIKENNNPTENPDNKDKNGNLIEKYKNNDLVKILVISGLCLVLVVLIILIFIPTKHRKNRYYYEE